MTPAPSADIVRPPLAPYLLGEPVFYGGKCRSTDAWLAWAKGRPTTIAAWALRDIIEELILRRAEMAQQSDGDRDE